MKSKLTLLVVVVTGLVAFPAAAQESTYHHMHLTAPDAKAASAWYIEHMGCEDFGREGACAVGDTQFIWFEREPTGTSVGTGVNHIGFSFRDLGAKMAGWQAAGLDIENPDEPIRDIPGLFKLAFLLNVKLSAVLLILFMVDALNKLMVMSLLLLVVTMV